MFADWTSTTTLMLIVSLIAVIALDVLFWTSTAPSTPPKGTGPFDLRVLIPLTMPDEIGGYMVVDHSDSGRVITVPFHVDGVPDWKINQTIVNILREAGLLDGRDFDYVVHRRGNNWDRFDISYAPDRPAVVVLTLERVK